MGMPPLLPFMLMAIGASRAGQDERPEPDLAAKVAHVDYAEVRQGDCAIAAIIVVGRLLDLELPDGDTEEQIRLLRETFEVSPYEGVDGDEVALRLMQIGAGIRERHAVRLSRLMARLTAGDLALVVGRYEFYGDLHAVVVAVHPDYDGRWLIVHDSNYEAPYVATYREVQAFRRRGEGLNPMYLVKSRK